MQLLEDVEDTLNCTAFEEDSLYRKLNCKCVNMITLSYLLMTHFEEAWRFVIFVIGGGNPSCWVKLNMEAMRKEYQTVRSKRLALGKVVLIEEAALCGVSPIVISICIKTICCTLMLLFLLSFFFPTEMRRKASPWQRNLGYPLAMIVLLALTVNMI